MISVSRVPPLSAQLTDVNMHGGLRHSLPVRLSSACVPTRVLWGQVGHVQDTARFGSPWRELTVSPLPRPLNASVRHARDRACEGDSAP